MIVVFCSFPDADEAEAMARQLVEARLAACVQILPKMKSFYVWEGAVQSDDEHLALIKTTRDKFEQLRIFIEANHSYEVPEVIAIEAELVSEKYLAWMEEALR